MEENQMPLQTEPMPLRPVKKSGLSMAIKIFLLIIVLAVVGGGLALASRVWDPLWNPFRPKPAEVLNKAIEKMQTIKSMHSNIQLGLDMSAMAGKNASLSVSGDSDISDKENMKGQLDFLISTKDSDSTKDILVSGQLKIIGKDAYIKFDDLSDYAKNSLKAQKVDFSSIKGVWLKLPPQEESSFSIPADKTQFYDEVKQMAIESKVYYVKQELPDEKISRENVYHYLVAIDSVKLGKLIGQVVDKAMKENGTTDGMAIIAVGMVKGIVTEFLDRIGDINIDFYIGKKDNYVYKYNLQKDIDLSFFSPEFKSPIKVSLQMDMEKFNDKFNILAPESFKEYDDIAPVPSINKNPFGAGLLNAFPNVLPAKQ